MKGLISLGMQNLVATPVFYCELCPSIIVFLFSKGYFLLELDSPLLAKKLSCVCGILKIL